MPVSFARPCGYPGCRRYAVKGSCYCEEHRTQVAGEFDRHRGSQRERGYTRAWEKVRRAFLIANPLCIECQKNGITKPATDVDHIIAHKGDMNIFWNKDNLQPLCHECHSRKTALEDSNWLRHPKGESKK